MRVPWHPSAWRHLGDYCRGLTRLLLPDMEGGDHIRVSRDRARNTHVSQRLRKQGSHDLGAVPISNFTSKGPQRLHSIHRLPSAASGCRWTLANLIVYGVPKWAYAAALFLPSKRRLVTDPPRGLESPWHRGLLTCHFARTWTNS